MRPATEPILWGSPRGPGNRSSLLGHTGTPSHRAEPVSTGALVHWTRRVTDGLLVHAGSTVRRHALDGKETWQRGDLSIGRIVGLVEHDGHDGALIVVSRKSSIVAIHAGTGYELWRYQEPVGRDVSGVGSVRLARVSGRDILVIAPGYSTVLSCFDLSNPGDTRLLWEHDLGDSIDAGFGPVLIIADVLGTGTPQLVASSRVGSSYEDDEGDLGTERIVLGRRDGQLYQAIFDLADGRLLRDVAYRPDDGPYPCARPYGLFQAVGREHPDLVLVSCQVEEYVSVTSTLNGLSRRWGWFVEKDWPVDEQELRPQTTSIADVMGDGRPRLVVGHWDGVTWATLVLDVIGEHATGERLRLENRYFWGCADLDGSGTPALVTSLETERRTTGRTRLEVLDARTGTLAGFIDDVAIVTTSDDELPADRTFHADRRGIATITDAQGRRALVLQLPDSTTVAWSPADGSRELWSRPVARVDDRPGGTVLTDVDGRLIALDAQLRPEAVIATAGRTPNSLLWRSGDRPELVAETAQGTVRCWSFAAGTAEPIWEVAGQQPTLHVDAAGVRRLATAVPTGDGSTVRIWRLGEHGPETEWERTLPTQIDGLLAFGDSFTLFVAQRIGPHTTCATVLDEHGGVLWRDEEHSAWASDPLAFRGAGGHWLLAYDDHGVLLLRDARGGELVLIEDWTAAYTTPVHVRLPDRAVLVRADGTHGMEAIELDGTSLWRRSYGVFAVHPGNSAVVEHGDGALIAFCRRDGIMDVLDVATGDLRTTVPLGPQAERRPLLALGHLVVVGLASGDLIALDPTDGTIVWSLSFDCAVETLAAIADSESTTLAVGTADGRIHLLTTEEDAE